MSYTCALCYKITTEFLPRKHKADDQQDDYQEEARPQVL
jgi:hypothetical protein